MKYSEIIKENAARLLNQTPEEQALEVLSTLERRDLVDVAAAYARFENETFRKNRWMAAWQIMYRLAAALFIPMVFVTIWSLSRSDKESLAEYSMQEISTQPGMRSQVVLPDGSKIWLNGESSIRYPVPFHRNERTLSLSGEAFFDVARDEKRPMVISAGNAQIRVLGTSFNVSAYPGEPYQDLSLVSGQVRLTLFKGDRELEAKTLNAGEYAYVEAESIITRKDDPEKYASWRYGKLVFDETPMPELTRKLERWFGVDVVVEDRKLNSYRFTTTFNNQSLSQVLELLELSSPIDIEYDPGSFDKITGNTGKGVVHIRSRK